jgi:predicted acyl esterase
MDGVREDLMAFRSVSLGLCVLIVGAVLGCSGPGSETSSGSGVAAESSPVAEDSGTFTGAKTPYPGGRWTVPEPTHGSAVETDVEIEMSDGVVLVGDVTYPADLDTGERASGTFPVLLTQDPYGGMTGILTVLLAFAASVLVQDGQLIFWLVGLTAIVSLVFFFVVVPYAFRHWKVVGLTVIIVCGAAWGWLRFQLGAPRGEFFATHGYIFVSVDVRGTSRSEGEQDMFSVREAKDGAELVTWASKLDGSDGRVGLQGCSYLGITQLETATQLGPHSPVKAMIPACSSADFYRDTLSDNGIPGPVARAIPGVWDDASVGGDMAYYREYWRSRDRVARAPAIAAADIPALMWVGWHESVSVAAFELYTALQNLAAGRRASAPITAGQEVSGKYQVIIGDWGHAGGLDQGIELQWYDTWIKGVDTGLPKNTKTPLHVGELGGTKRWVNASMYPLVETYTPFFLAEAGKLSRSAADGEGRDELMWAAPGEPIDSIEYATEPFADGAMLAGPMAARLEVTSSNSNLQLLIEIFDRAPDGTTTPISHGSILGSLRRMDAEKSWLDENGLPTRPYLSLDEDEPLTPGRPTRLDVPLRPSLWSIEPEHSIVVRISTQVDPQACSALIGSAPFGCNLTNPMLETLPGGVYQLHRDSKLSSLISLPLLGYGELTTAESAVSPTNGFGSPIPTGEDKPALPIDW